MFRVFSLNCRKNINLIKDILIKTNEYGRNFLKNIIKNSKKKKFKESLYKLVVKMLVVKLGMSIYKLISLNQTEFLKGEISVDEVMVVNDVIDFAKKSKKSCLIFKVAFDVIKLIGIFWITCLSDMDLMIT